MMKKIAFVLAAICAGVLIYPARLCQALGFSASVSES
jgi:hypothetical protein